MTVGQLKFVFICGAIMGCIVSNEGQQHIFQFAVKKDYPGFTSGAVNQNHIAIAA